MLGKINPAKKQISSAGEIINDIDNKVYEAKTLTSQHKHFKPWPRHCENVYLDIVVQDISEVFLI